MSDSFTVVFPIGGLGNHLRWLLMLDPKFNFKFINFKITRPHFYAVQQTLTNNSTLDPNIQYEEFYNQDFSLLDEQLLNEYVRCYDLPMLDFTSPTNKIKSIEQYVYHSNRSWHNWLYNEWKFRKKLDSFIKLEHWPNNIKDPNEKLIFICPEDPQWALKHYIKFNSSLNNTPQLEFLWQIEIFKENAKTVTSNHSCVCTLKSEDLLNPVLDKDFYQTAIDHFGFSNCYDDANYIHGLWYDLQLKSQSEIIKDLQNFYINK